MTKVPSAVWIVDTKKEHLAVDEARKLGIPIVAILDTNCDPDEVDYKIPGNDDAIRSVTLLTRVVADAVAAGLMQRSRAAESKADGGLAVDEPLAEWEAELLAGDAAPAAEATAPEAPAVEAPAAEAVAEPVVEAPVEALTETVGDSLPAEAVEAAVDAEVAAEAPAEPAAESADQA